MLANSPAMRAYLRLGAGRQSPQDGRTRVVLVRDGMGRARRTALSAPPVRRPCSASGPVYVVSLCSAGHAQARPGLAAALVACGLMLAEAVNRALCVTLRRDLGLQSRFQQSGCGLRQRKKECASGAAMATGVALAYRRDIALHKTATGIPAT
jgi:hypothetical protein